MKVKSHDEELLQNLFAAVSHLCRNTSKRFVSLVFTLQTFGSTELTFLCGNYSFAVFTFHGSLAAFSCFLVSLPDLLPEKKRKKRGRLNPEAHFKDRELSSASVQML